jgi:hypothetical protein
MGMDATTPWPTPVLDGEDGLLALYDEAWKLAREHIQTVPGLPQSPYMDEGFDPSTLWIWDTCFMAQFCKYAPRDFPGVESLENFYVPMLDGGEIPLRIEIPDNPPLFAWTEYEHFKVTGDLTRVRRIVQEKRWLQRHFEWFESCKPGVVIANSAPTCLERVDHRGYHWEGGRSGMDNTPRGRAGSHAIAARPNNPHMLWLDAIAQQGLSALCIARLLEAVGEQDEAASWQVRYAAITAEVNAHYWDEEDGVYYDIDERDGRPIKVLTPASFWPMLARMPTREQAERLVGVLTDPQLLGGPVPWVSLARNDPDFNPRGGYWRGSVWPPTAYMGIKALQNYGRLDLAHETACAVVAHMEQTFREFEPHTIWECYHPTLPEPAVDEYPDEPLCRPDFCGWSALGPISLLIENVLGFHDIDAATNTVRWHRRLTERHGIRNLRFGAVETDIISDAAPDDTHGARRIDVVSNRSYTLIVDGRSLAVEAGHQIFCSP